MKKIIIAFLAILFGVNAMSQSYGDTIDFMPRQPNYYYNDWWVTPWVDTSDGILYHGYASECFLRYNYTDRPLKIVGLAAALFVLRNTPPWGLVFDSMETDEYLLLCDARPDTFVRVEQVQWNITDSHHYIQITTYPGYVDYGADCCRNGSPTEIVLPLYTYYFDKPVIVNDSFYIGNTDNFSWTHSDPPHQYDGYRYSEGVSSLVGPPPNRIPPCSYDSPSCLPILQKYRHEYWDYDGRRRVSYRYLSGYTLIFPIVEHPDCLKIRTVQRTCTPVVETRQPAHWLGSGMGCGGHAARLLQPHSVQQPRSGAGQPGNCRKICGVYSLIMPRHRMGLLQRLVGRHKVLHPEPFHRDSGGKPR